MISTVYLNDAFVMNAWAKQQDIKNVKVIPMDLETLQDTWVCLLVRTI